jgi:predicted Zn-dependent protease
MTSPDLKMSLPEDHQKDTQDSVCVAEMVVEPSELHVPPVSDVKAAALSQAAAHNKIKMKVDKVRGPTAPQEIKGELVSAMGELRDTKVQGRTEKCYDVKKQVSLPITTNTMVMHSVVKKYKAVKYAVVEDMLGTPLSLSTDSVKEDSTMYDDKMLEEVLAELGMQLEGLSSYQEQKCYEVAEWRSKDKEHSKKARLMKKVKLGRRCQEVLKDAVKPHLPTSVLGVYWMAASATNRL